MAFVKSWIVSLSISSVWFVLEYMQFGELQGDRICDNVVFLLYLLVIWYLFCHQTKEQKHNDHSEKSLFSEKERLIVSDEDCADCLCRVCARNMCNDSYNHISEEDGRSCECNCKIGDILIETEDDCPDFLPDEDIV